jgi:hypothetical protein
VSLSGLSAVYDGRPHAVVAAVVPPGPSVSLTYNGSPVPPTSAGSYFVSALSSQGFSINGTLVVSPRPLVLRGANMTVTEGATFPIPTGSVSGLVAEDGISITWVTTAPLTAEVGTWPVNGIIIDPLRKLSNYSVSNTPGTITVTAIADNPNNQNETNNPPGNTPVDPKINSGGDDEEGGQCGFGAATAFVFAFGLLWTCYRRRSKMSCSAS